MIKPYSHEYSLVYSTTKKNWEFKLQTDTSRQYIDELFEKWQKVTYIWTPENFKKYLRMQHRIVARISEAHYVNLD